MRASSRWDAGILSRRRIRVIWDEVWKRSFLHINIQRNICKLLTSFSVSTSCAKFTVCSTAQRALAVAESDSSLPTIKPSVLHKMNRLLIHLLGLSPFPASVIACTLQLPLNCSGVNASRGVRFFILTHLIRSFTITPLLLSSFIWRWARGNNLPFKCTCLYANGTLRHYGHGHHNNPKSAFLKNYRWYFSI